YILVPYILVPYILVPYILISYFMVSCISAICIFGPLPTSPRPAAMPYRPSNPGTTLRAIATIGPKMTWDCGHIWP
ncbi:MAG: hypothetical protein PVI60_08275, partial [Desulfobacteraceae bacterium]